MTFIDDLFPLISSFRRQHPPLLFGPFLFLYPSFPLKGNDFPFGPAAGRPSVALAFIAEPSQGNYGGEIKARRRRYVGNNPSSFYLHHYISHHPLSDKH